MRPNFGQLDMFRQLRAACAAMGLGEREITRPDRLVGEAYSQADSLLEVGARPLVERDDPGTASNDFTDPGRWTMYDRKDAFKPATDGLPTCASCLRRAGQPEPKSRRVQGRNTWER